MTLQKAAVLFELRKSPGLRRAQARRRPSRVQSGSRGAPVSGASLAGCLLRSIAAALHGTSTLSNGRPRRTRMQTRAYASLLHAEHRSALPERIRATEGPVTRVPTKFASPKYSAGRS